MEQERSISDPDLGTGGEGDGLLSSGIPRSIKSLQKCHNLSDLTQHFSQPGVTDCPTPCPGPNDLPSLVACCSIGCQEDSTSSCIRCLTTPVNFQMSLSITHGLCLHVPSLLPTRYCCSPDSLHLPLHAGPGLLGGVVLMGGLAVAVVVW